MTQATWEHSCSSIYWGFFDNINPERVMEVFQNKGFLENVCIWILSFLTGRRATLWVGTHTSALFDITNGTLQGSPLSPILSAMYTSHLLTLTEMWTFKELMLYIDDGMICCSRALDMTARAHGLDSGIAFFSVLDC